MVELIPKSLEAQLSTLHAAPAPAAPPCSWVVASGDLPRPTTGDGAFASVGQRRCVPRNDWIAGQQPIELDQVQKGWVERWQEGV